jgi:cytochrome P450
VFPEPNKFDPSRWLAGGEYGTREMQGGFFAWGRGNRSCVGKTMATMNLRIWASTILSRLKVRLASEQTHDDMEHTDHFALVPKGKKCMLILEDP